MRKEVEQLVSIIIPTHTGSNVIERAVDSALNQTYNNIEVVIVDDNGKGTEEQIKTSDVMKKYSERKNVRYIVHEQSMHGSAARNTGAKYANGKYLAFLDDDDFFENENIERHIKRLSQTDSSIGFSYCGMRLINPGIPNEVIMPKYEGDILYDFLMSKIRIGSSLIVVKTSVFDEMNGFDPSFKRHQDWEFIVRILDKYKVAAVDFCGVNKIVLGRNQATKGELFEKYRIYYLEKMQPIISKLSPKEQNCIYDIHYSQIAKAYLKNKQFGKTLYWVHRMKYPQMFFKKTISDAFVYLRKRM